MACLVVVCALAACAGEGDEADDGPGSSTDASAVDEDAPDEAGPAAGDEDADDGDDRGPAVSSVTQPTTTLPECEAGTVIAAPADWPHPVPDQLRVLAADVPDRQTYRLEGVTNDADGLVIAAMDTMFPDLDVTEPSGDAASIELEFSDATASASVALDDADGDGCWDVAVAVSYVEPPDVEVVDPTEPADGDSSDGDGSEDDEGDAVPPTSAPSFEFDEATSIGRAQVITARGTFTLFVMSCTIDPVFVDAAAADGALTITGTPSDLEVTWTYADGVVIEDDDPNVVGLDSSGGAMFTEGDGPDGPESLVIEYFCE